MVRPLRVQYPGAFYHVTCRGNNKQPVFSTDGDRRVFLRLLEESLRIYQVALHAYVLMENHLHLLVETPRGNLGEFMRRLTIAYTSFFNRAHGSVGHLFQGRYKALLVDKDNYLTALTRYIHANPVRTRAWKDRPAGERLAYLREYRWSSLPGYLRKGDEERWLSYETVLGRAGQEREAARRQYARDVEAELREEWRRLTGEAVGGMILGSMEFVAWVREKFLEKERSDRERPPVEALARRDPGAIVVAVGDALGMGKDTVLTQRGVGRTLAMEFLYRYGGMNNREIGKLVRLDYSTVSVTRSRLRQRLTKDAGLRRQHAAAERKVSRIKI